MFKAWADKHMSDEELRTLQNELIVNPKVGDVIQGTGGARKIRVAYGGKGKRGAGRAIYVYLDQVDNLYLLMGVHKADAADLTTPQRKQLKAVIDTLR